MAATSMIHTSFGSYFQGEFYWKKFGFSKKKISPGPGVLNATIAKWSKYLKMRIL